MGWLRRVLETQGAIGKAFDSRGLEQPKRAMTITLNSNNHLDLTVPCLKAPGTYRDRKGYARRSWREHGKPRTEYRHRLAYEAAVGPIPRGREWHVHHACHVVPGSLGKECVEPRHLALIRDTDHAVYHAAQRCLRVAA